MERKPIRVGFVGLNPDTHWAVKAHIPALRCLAKDYEIVAVANSKMQSSQAAATILHIPQAFASAKELVNAADIDLVVITVKVPYHLELVKAALTAGKNVFCEWPLGNGVAEAREMADLAKARGLLAVTSMQMRVAPEVPYLKKLIADGFVGKVLSTTLVGSGGGWGGSTTADQAYTFDKANGATMLSIPLAHTLAGFVDVLGDIDTLSATMLNLRSTVKVTDTGGVIPKTTEDQIMVHGALQSGAAFSLHYRGGFSRGVNFLWEINGTNGDLQVTAQMGHAQLAALQIRGAKGEEKALQTLTPPVDASSDWPENPMARNIAHVYALIAADIRTGSRTAPSFQDAVKLHELVDAIEHSARTPT